MMRQKAAGGAVDVEGRVVRGIASDETVDRMGDLILQGPEKGEPSAGWELEAFRKNGPFLLSHSYSNLPIGRVAVEKRLPRKPRALAFEATLATTPEAETVLGLYKDGFLRAVSVGFKAIRARRPDEEDLKAWPELRRILFVRFELLELSAVSVPANPNALVGERALDFAASEGRYALQTVAKALEPFVPDYTRALRHALTLIEQRSEDRGLLAAAAERARRREFDSPRQRFELTAFQLASLHESSRASARRQLQEKIAAARSSHR